MRSEKTMTASMSKETSSGSKVKFEATLVPEENARSSQMKVTFDSSKTDNELRLHSDNAWLKLQNDRLTEQNGKLTEQNNFLMNTCKEMEATVWHAL